MAAVIPEGILFDDFSAFTFDCVRFDASFAEGGMHRPQISQLVSYGTEYSFAGFEWTVSNGSDSIVTQLQGLDIHSADIEDHTRKTFFMGQSHLDLGRHYFANGVLFDIIGIDSYHGEGLVAEVGNVFDASYVEMTDEDELDRGVCGWYFAYDTDSGYNRGFAPIICDL